MPKKPKPLRPTYSQRAGVLRILGFASYPDYLASELWAEIRSATLDRDSNKCRLCNERAHVVHHIDYSEATLKGDRFESLVSVCRGCHKRIEFTKDGRKRTLLQAMDEYYAICRRTIPKKNRNRCVACNNRAKRKSTMCRPCLKKHSKKETA